MKMGLCPKCGQLISVNEQERLGICSICGSPFRISEVLARGGVEPNDTVIVSPAVPRNVVQNSRSRSITDEVGNQEALYTKIDVALTKKDYNRALQLANHATEYFSGSPKAWFMLARSITNDFSDLAQFERCRDYVDKGHSLLDSGGTNPYESAYLQYEQRFMKRTRTKSILKAIVSILIISVYAFGFYAVLMVYGLDNWIGSPIVLGGAVIATMSIKTMYSRKKHLHRKKRTRDT